MKTLKFFIPLLTAIIIISCSDNSTGINVDKSTFTYPFTNGSTWNYQGTFSVENIRPDSIKHYFSNYPVNGSGVITILYDTLINSVQCKCFNDNYIELGSTFNSRTYYINTDTGLICYGHRDNSSPAGFPYRFTRKLKFIFNNKVYDNINLLRRMFLGNELMSVNNINDIVIQYTPPIVCLSYPITEGKQWSFMSSSGTTYVFKKYIDFELVSINNQNYSCIKTERICVNESNFYLYDYHSKYGQLKRDYLYANNMCLNEFGDTLGFYDARTKMNVTSFNIP